MLTPIVVVLAVAGGLWGFVADRIAARWPAHEDGSIRAIDWRTPIAVIVGGIALALVPARFEGDTTASVIFGVYVVALTLLLATDLDQRLLPNEITLPAIPLAFLVSVLGLNPLVPVGVLPIAVVVAVLVPGALWLLARPFGAGAIGQGDLKLLVSVGPARRAAPDVLGRRLRRAARGGGDRRAARAAADHAQDVHPVRAVPDHRRALGTARPALGLLHPRNRVDTAVTESHPLQSTGD